MQINKEGLPEFEEIDIACPGEVSKILHDWIRANCKVVYGDGRKMVWDEELYTEDDTHKAYLLPPTLIRRER